MKITDGKKVLEVSQRAFDVIYRYHGFVECREEVEESEKKASKVKQTGKKQGEE